MRPEAIVNVAPVVVEHAGLEHGVEDLTRKELIAGLAVEALYEGVLPRTAGLDVGRPGASPPAPVLDGCRDQLGTVVGADELGCTASLARLIEAASTDRSRCGAGAAPWRRPPSFRSTGCASGRGCAP